MMAYFFPGLKTLTVESVRSFLIVMSNFGSRCISEISSQCVTWIQTFEDVNLAFIGC